MPQKPSPKFGDKVRIKAKNQELSGIFIPSANPKIILLKLDSGYNMGIEKNKIISLTIESSHKNEKQENQGKKFQNQNKSLPKISIISVGGTITSKIDYKTGAVLSLSSPYDIIKNIPELQAMAYLSYSQPFTIMSESMRFAHYNLLAKEIERIIKTQPKGIIIAHGTDTLHYSAAALAIMIPFGWVFIIR